MDTSPQDRLAILFANQKVSKPRPPIASEKTFGEKDIEEQMARQAAWHQPKPHPRKQSDQIEATQQDTPSKPQWQPYSDSESDEYAAAFAKKPSMKPPKTKSTKQGPGRMGKYRSGAAKVEDFSTYKDLRQDLPSSDSHGNPVTDHYCVLSLAAKFPYKYMDDGNDRVSRHFFSNGKFFERTWNLYYVHPPESAHLQPILLLPYKQFKDLIDEIAAAFQADIAVPAFPFTLTFFADGTPQPRLLGTSKSREEMNELEENIRPPTTGHGEPSQDASVAVKEAFAAFRAKCERVATANKKKKNASAKKKKETERVVQLRSWCQSLHRIQRYLGLLPPRRKIETLASDTPWDEQVKFMQQQDQMTGIAVELLDVQKIAPFEFDKAPVFVCIDIESYERAHHLITEVGISTLDTLDLVDLAPGESGSNWRRHIRSRHFRIAEHTHYRNKDFCPGDPDAFQFGSSEFVSLAEIGDKIDSCFEWPYSVQFKHDGRVRPEYESWDALTQKVAVTSMDDCALPVSDHRIEEIEGLQKGAKERNILLVGHGLSADLAYLAKLNSSIFSPDASAVSHPPIEGDYAGTTDPKLLRGAKVLHSIKEALDTAILYKVLRKDQQTKGLGAMLYDLEINAFFLHNGGNDARYTLEALVSLIVRARQESDKANASKEAELNKLAEGW